MIVSFDFDGTLCWVNKKNVSIFRRNIKIFNILKNILENKDELIIVTFRDPKNETEEKKEKENRVLINDYINKYNLNIKKIIFTNHMPKLPYLIENNVDIHYDDDDQTIETLKNTSIKGILVKKKIK